MNLRAMYMVVALLAVCVYNGESHKTCAAAAWDQEPITPIPFAAEREPAKAALGEKLFHDPRLSHSNAMACATCHQLTQGGGDGLPLARTADGTFYSRNTPTIFNAALNTRYGWDGAVRSLEAEVEATLHSPAMMNTTWSDLLTKLRTNVDYLTAFNMVYAGGLSAQRVLDALTTYVRTLLTPNSRFDQYLRGQSEALTTEEQRGYHLFKAYGCAACHQGVNVGGNMFQKFGIFQGDSPPRDDDDLGRFTLTGVARDRNVFRVPSLRNVAVTAPYYHDGRIETLENAVDLMARRQLGMALTPEENRLIVRFLRTLTGEYQGRSLALSAKEKP